MMIVEVLIFALIFVLSIPVFVIFLQTILALFPQRQMALGSGARPRIAIIIPAHNEAMLIERTLQSLMPQMHEGDRVLVIADNCTDETATLARKSGAEAIERADVVNRGKGYALDYGVRHLQENPPEVLMIVDADCQVGEGMVSRLAFSCMQFGRPVQSLYLMRSPPGASLKTRIAEFAWLFKNKVRPSGWHRIHMPCHLMGSGMAFSWSAISQAKLASGHIVEDLKLGIDLALAGHAPLFLREAVVTSYFPGNNAGLESQRARWEHGHIGVILKEGPKLLMQAIRKLDV
ncbi:MAG: glycosyltransferase family 2 protein, partial [Nitrosomonadales bacterium]|nr:glycosyltransferase family 2 protein [Nitrosomonadales bacterium]